MYMIQLNINGMRKPLLLALLAIQNSLSVLLVKYTRSNARESERHVPSTCILFAELLKLAIVLFVLFFRHGRRAIITLRDEVFLSRETIFIGLPAALFAAQSNLIWLSLTLLPAPLYMLTSQVKIAITALFSVFMLNMKLSSQQYISLAVLQFGVIIVQLENIDWTLFTVESGYMAGLLAVLAACSLSGFSSVFIEIFMKKKDKTASQDDALWIRNVQLGIYSVILGCIVVLYFDGESIKKNGFLYGYTVWVWGAVVNASVGGLLVAAVMKYTDNVAKSFATSASICLSLMASCFMFGFIPSKIFTIGAVLICVSIGLYAIPLRGLEKLFA